jgi:hypothetical protein
MEDMELGCPRSALGCLSSLLPIRSMTTRSNQINSGRPLTIMSGAAISVLSATAQGGITNLVQDGDFEMARVPAGSFSVFAGTSTAIPDWTVGGVEVALVSSSYTEDGYVFAAQSGTQWLDLSGGSGPDRTNQISQTIITEAGRQYDLSFYVGSAWTNAGGGPFKPATVDVIINGGTRTSYTNSNVAIGTMNWEFFSTTFVATSTSTTLQFLYGNAGDLNFAVGVDTVMVSVVPAPGVLSLAASACLASRRRRRA